MPELRPFRGIRYSSPNDLGDLACPPYDVISPEEQGLLHDRHPHNAIRLELGRSDDQHDRYAAAAQTFEEWLASGVLTSDDRESLYVYRQDFVAPDGSRARVVGVIGALALEPFGDSSGVLPHEKTMPGPKQDRLALMRALPLNVSPIYAIYRGSGDLAPFFGDLENRPTEGRFADDSGILHRLWVITAPAEIDMLRSAVRPGPLVIADGHHRYETALAYHQERGATPGDHGSIMCFCVDADADAEGIVVLPYHRALRAVIDAGSLAERIEARSGARNLHGDDPFEAIERSGSDHPMVFVLPEGDFLVEIDDDAVVASVGERHPAWRALDVVALHEVVLPQVLATTPEEMAFSKDEAHIRKLVAEGWSAGILMRAVTAAGIVDVAGSGERMPQKASYFWPKAVTGLVFHPLS